MIVPPEYQISEQHKFYLKHYVVNGKKAVFNAMDVAYFNLVADAEKRGIGLSFIKGRGRL